MVDRALVDDGAGTVALREKAVRPALGRALRRETIGDEVFSVEVTAYDEVIARNDRGAVAAAGDLPERLSGRRVNADEILLRVADDDLSP